MKENQLNKLNNQVFPLNQECSLWLGEYSGSALIFNDNNLNQNPQQSFIQFQENLSKKYNVSYQIFNNNHLFSVEHARMIIHRVLQTFQEDTHISNTPSLEFLLYLSCQRQIKEAIEEVGIKFPMNSDQTITFQQIIFGHNNSVKMAIDYLQNSFPNLTEKNINFPLSKNWDIILKKYEIKIDVIKIMLISEKYQNLDKCNDVIELQKIIPINDIEKAINIAINEKMLELFLKNYKNQKEK